jgi:hypothetical protein
MNDNGAGVTKLALLIDGDNISATFMPLILREATKLGVVAIRRIYGQFKSGKMKSWLKHVDEFDLTAVNVSPLTRGKNATDMKLVIEAMDMLYGRQLDGFCIASSDGDFTPLAARIRANAIAAYGFGAKKAPAGYKAEFDRFYECDALLAAEKKGSARKVPAQRPIAPPVAQKPTPRQDIKAPAAPRGGRAAQQTRNRLPIPATEILSAIDEVRESDGWSHLGAVSNRVRRTIKDFSPKAHGHATMKRLVAAIGDVESKTMPGGAMFVRRKAS